MKTGPLLGMLTIAFALLSPAFSYAQQPEDDNLPDPGLLPDNPFYGLKRAWEAIGTAFTFGDEAKALGALELAQTRLAEAQAMANTGKPEFVESLLEDYGNSAHDAIETASSLGDENDKEAVMEKVASATTKHLSVLDDVQDKVPDDVKDVVSAARDRAMRGSTQALMVLAQENPQVAAEIAVDAADNRVDRIKQAVSKGDDEEALQAAEDYEELAHTGDTIAELAKTTDDHPQEVLEIVSTARAAHIEVLAGVLEDAPEEASPTIQRVLEDSEQRLESFSLPARSDDGEDVNSEETDNVDDPLLRGESEREENLPEETGKPSMPEQVTGRQ